MSRFRRPVILPSLLLFSLAFGGGQKLARQERIEEMQPEVPSSRSPAGSTSGVYHILRQGQTLYSVARAYDVPLEGLAALNGITDPTRIPAGKALFVPGARRLLDIKPSFLPALEWPLSGRITSGFEVDGGRPTHEGNRHRRRDGAGGPVRRARAGRPGRNRAWLRKDGRHRPWGRALHPLCARQQDPGGSGRDRERRGPCRAGGRVRECPGRASSLRSTPGRTAGESPSLPGKQRGSGPAMTTNVAGSRLLRPPPS